MNKTMFGTIAAIIYSVTFFAVVKWYGWHLIPILILFGWGLNLQNRMER